MEDMELIDRMLKSKRLSMQAHMLLDGLKVKHLKFGSFTEPQKQLILKVAKNNGIDVVLKKGPLTIQVESIKEPDTSVLTEDERKEIFSFMKDCAYGKHSRQDALSYAEMLARALNEKGVKVAPWKKIHRITREWVSDNDPNGIDY